MSNVLNEEKKQQVIALGKLGWTLRRIEQATGVRRETAGAYLKASGIAVRPPGGWGRRSSKPANGVITDSADSKPANEAGVTTDFIRPSLPLLRGRSRRIYLPRVIATTPFQARDMSIAGTQSRDFVP